MPRVTRMGERRCRLATRAVTALLVGMTQVHAAESGLSQALTGGKTSLSLRLRFEHVTDEAFAREANAPTFRLRLGYTTQTWRHAAALLEVDHLGYWGGDAFNSTRNGRFDRPAIADPDATDLNQFALKVNTARNEWVLGRQRLALDNQRFVGAAGWRQNEQTFDAALWRTQLVPHLALSYVFIGNVNTVFGPDAGAPPPDLRLRGHVLQAGLDLHGAGKVSAFGHWFDVHTTPALSHRNLGLLWTGSTPLGPHWKLPWSASWARQYGYGRNPTAYAASYAQLELGVARDYLGLRAGVEILGGDATRANRMFQTPLASLHTYQGWADKFLTTPAQGLRDQYFVASARRWGWEAQLAWHAFSAEAVSRDYGKECDLSLSRKLSKRGELLLKAADYRADGLLRDTRKLWLQLSADLL